MTWESPQRLWLLLAVAALAVAYIVMQRRRRTILWTAAVPVLLALLYGLFATPLYTASVQILIDPRDRRMRSLYHVISGRELMARGEETAAATQFEAALAHDRNCREAREALEELRASGLHSGLYPRTLR